ncbi:MAG: formylmethanofuran dehydrogenase subunit C [Candidatus Bathyarchaeota archaeon]
MILLSPKHRFSVPIDAENVTPDEFVGKSLKEIQSLKVWEGNRERVLGDLFHLQRVQEAPDSEATIRLVGDFTQVKRIGAKMSQGQIVVEGNVGMRLGEQMKGGTISVTGQVGSWAGMMLHGGIIEITGDAGDYVGSSYRGSTVGMTGGTIIVHGNAGNEVGCYMNNGLIKIGGNVEQFVGMHMQGGTILVAGDSEGRVGAEMMGGRIVVLGQVPSFLPSFIIDSIRKSVRVEADRVEGPFYLFNGDVTESWKGAVYVSTLKNPHLKFYETKIV